MYNILFKSGNSQEIQKFCPQKFLNSEGTLVMDPKKLQQQIENFYSNLNKSNALTPCEAISNS